MVFSYISVTATDGGRKERGRERTYMKKTKPYSHDIACHPVQVATVTERYQT